MSNEVKRRLGITEAQWDMGRFKSNRELFERLFKEKKKEQELLAVIAMITRTLEEMQAKHRQEILEICSVMSARDTLNDWQPEAGTYIAIEDRLNKLQPGGKTNVNMIAALGLHTAWTYSQMERLNLGEPFHSIARGDLITEGSQIRAYNKIIRSRALRTFVLHEILGNPFRLVTFNPDWRTGTVTAIAKSMYDSRDFGPMPLLADALGDAGCENSDVLNHCRDETRKHIRGCWVVEGILDKSGK